MDLQIATMFGKAIVQSMNFTSELRLESTPESPKWCFVDCIRHIGDEEIGEEVDRNGRVSPIYADIYRFWFTENVNGVPVLQSIHLTLCQFNDPRDIKEFGLNAMFSYDIMLNGVCRGMKTRKIFAHFVRTKIHHNVRTFEVKKFEGWNIFESPVLISL